MSSNEKLQKFEIKVPWIYGGCLVSSLCLLFIYILGAARYLTDLEPNTCEMTYMFEYPQYVRIALDETIEDRFPRFALYAYGEGFVTQKLRRMHFSGIPVLFIPGNAGSYEQVRSLASVSLRKGLKSRSPFHFDFFTVDLGKDYSGLYGGVLMEETVYVSHCIERILKLYGGKMFNVVLIGHSMGGIITKGVSTLLPNTNSSLASLIINLATPHVPALIPDSTFASYYERLKTSASTYKDSETVIVSIGGGPRDVLVPSSQTIDDIADINVLSTRIPGVWRSTDHLCILWCNELVITIIRALFDCVDIREEPYRITSDRESKIRALSYNFLNRYAGKKLYPYVNRIEFQQKGEWIEKVERQYVWSRKNNIVGPVPMVYLMIRIADPSDYLTIEVFDLEYKDWLFVCNADSTQGHSKTCQWGWNLTNRTRMTPDYTHRLRKTVELDMNDMKKLNMSHIVIRIHPSDLHQAIIHVDLHKRALRNLKLEPDSSYFRTFFGLSLLQPVETVAGSIEYYVTLLDSMNVVTIELKDSTCTETKPETHALIEVLEPWYPGISQIRFFTQTDNGPKTVTLQTSSNERKDPAVLRLLLDPSCSYRFNVQKSSAVHKVAVLVRDRWPILYTIAVSLLLLAIATRIDHGNGKTATVLITAFLYLLLGLSIEGFVVIAILHIVAIGICCSVIFFGSVAHNVAIRFLARAVTLSTTLSDWVLAALNQLPQISTLVVLSLIPATCGALGMLIALFLSFLNLTRAWEDYLEELLMSTLRHFKILKPLRGRSDDDEEESGSVRQKILNHVILFLMWTVAAIPAIPTALVWAKNFSYDTRLKTEDPILLATWVVLVICCTTGHVRIPLKYLGRRSQVLADILRFIGWLILFSAGTSNPSAYQWYIPPINAFGIALVALNTIMPGSTTR